MAVWGLNLLESQGSFLAKKKDAYDENEEEGKGLAMERSLHEGVFKEMKKTLGD